MSKLHKNGINKGSSLAYISNYLSKYTRNKLGRFLGVVFGVRKIIVFLQSWLSFPGAFLGHPLLPLYFPKFPACRPVDQAACKFSFGKQNR